MGASAQLAARKAHIGYVYPAGGQQGTTFIVRAGGQFLAGADSVRISGEGVAANVLLYAPPRRNLNGDQRRELVKRMAVVWLAGTAAATDWQGDLELPFWLELPEAPEDAEETELPNHALLNNLDQLTLEELVYIHRAFFWPINQLQRQPSLDEIVRFEVTIAPDAEPGERTLRIHAAAGMTEPLRFIVGREPELNAWEQNDPVNMALPMPEAPVTFNGQCLAGDVDLFRFTAKQGQQLVIQAEARSLVPYLADAVPGWFQATLTLSDPEGNELAFVDDLLFDPDPVLLYSVPETGEYRLEVRDALYRGRDDFTYRVTIAEKPFITSMFPLGAREGETATAAIKGWNLPTDQLTLGTAPGGGLIRHAALLNDPEAANQVLYAVSSLPEATEVEPNDTAQSAQAVDLPTIINGRIGEAEDVDIFAFQGLAGENVVVETLARRLNSPLDSLVQIRDESGKTIAWNDDTPDKASGLRTHHADSHVTASIPSDGTYLVRLTDTRDHGGEAYAYRLRISRPQPDFALRVTPSSLRIPARCATEVTVHAVRRDGFAGDIDLALVDAPPGFQLGGARVPSGRDSARVTIMAPPQASPAPAALRLEGRAEINGVPTVRPAVPSDDVMQAFLYRHLVPTEELLAIVPWSPGHAEITDPPPGETLRVPAGGRGIIRVRAPRNAPLSRFRWTLSDPPEGITLGNILTDADGFSLAVWARGEELETGVADNLIIDVSAAGANRRRLSLGVLAVPYEVVAP